MGLFKALFRALARGETEEVTLPGPPRSTFDHGTAEVSVTFTTHNSEDFRLDVVGESHYQANLWRLKGPGRKPKDGLSLFETAEIVPEDDNPYDENAVRVDIEEMVVGYLSRDHAKLYRERFGTEPQECMAWVRGGFIMKDGKRASLGVRLKFEL